VDYAFMVRVLNGTAHSEEQLQSFTDCHPLAIAVLRDGNALDILHYEVRSAFGRSARVEDSRDIRVVHHRQRLPLVGEAGEYLVRVHPEFDDFERYTAANGFPLLGQVHGAHTPFAQRTKDLKTAEIVITGCRCRCIESLRSEFVRPNRTIENALDQAVWAESRGIAGIQFRCALRAIWHFGLICNSYCMPLPRTL
jgi:hypothetical protein